MRRTPVMICLAALAMTASVGATAQPTDDAAEDSADSADAVDIDTEMEPAETDATTVTSPPEQVQPALAQLADFATRVLAVHNRERARIGVPPQIWDATLAEHAQAWANQLARTGQMRHASGTGEGENLWAGSAGGYPPEEMVGSWLGEGANFKPGKFPAVARNPQGGAVGHYTQMIWRQSTRLGCAVATGSGNDYLVCRYAPAGNMVGDVVP